MVCHHIWAKFYFLYAFSVRYFWWILIFVNTENNPTETRIHRNIGGFQNPLGSEQALGILKYLISWVALAPCQSYVSLFSNLSIYRPLFVISSRNLNRHFGTFLNNRESISFLCPLPSRTIKCHLFLYSLLMSSDAFL